jgi:hypothetical protein
VSHTVAIHSDQNFGTSQLVLNFYSDLAHSRYKGRCGEGAEAKRRRELLICILSTFDVAL